MVKRKGPAELAPTPEQYPKGRKAGMYTFLLYIVCTKLDDIGTAATQEAAL